MAALGVVDPSEAGRNRLVAPADPITDCLDTTARIGYTRVIDDKDFFWLVGILEGEGTFLAGPPTSRGQPIVRVSMTDRDVVERIGAVIDRAVVPVSVLRSHYKTPYVTCMKGAPAVALMRAVRPHLGAVRRVQIDRAIASWHGHRARWRRPATRCSAMECPRRGSRRGLCKRHYDQWWKAAQRGRATTFGPSEAPEMSVRGEDVRDLDEAHAVAWLAGLLEGEGTFSVVRESTDVAYPQIKLEMCDENTVARAAQLIGAPSLRRREAQQEGWNPTYVAVITGQAAAVWMRRLRDLMGARRRGAIDTALREYHPTRLVDPPATCVVEGCCDPHRGRGLCHKHYMMWSRDKASGRAARITPLR